MVTGVCSHTVVMSPISVEGDQYCGGWHSSLFAYRCLGVVNLVTGCRESWSERGTIGVAGEVWGGGGADG